MSVPAPMAMPMSARVSAGASLIAVADHGHLVALFLQTADDGFLLRGQHVGNGLADVQLFADGLGGLAVVAGEHDHVEAHLPEAADGGAAGLAHGVGHGDNAEDAALAGEDERRLALAGEALHLRIRGGGVDAVFGEEGGVAGEVGFAVQRGLHATAGSGAEGLGFGHGEALLFGLFHHGLGQRVSLPTSTAAA